MDGRISEVTERWMEGESEETGWRRVVEKMEQVGRAKVVDGDKHQLEFCIVLQTGPGACGGLKD